MRRKVVAVPSATTSRAKVSKRENKCRGGGRVMRDTRVDSALEPKLRGILMALKDCLVNENSRKGRIHPGVMVKQLWICSPRIFGARSGKKIPQQSSCGEVRTNVLRTESSKNSSSKRKR